MLAARVFSAITVLPWLSLPTISFQQFSGQPPPSIRSKDSEPVVTRWKAGISLA